MRRRRLSRRALSFAVCDAWHWRQPNGTPCDAICRGLLLWLHRAGHIELPAPQWTTRKAWRPRTSAPPVLIDTTPIAMSLRALGPLVIHQVRRGCHLRSSDSSCTPAHAERADDARPGDAPRKGELMMIRLGAPTFSGDVDVDLVSDRRSWGILAGRLTAKTPVDRAAHNGPQGLLVLD